LYLQYLNDLWNLQSTQNGLFFVLANAHSAPALRCQFNMSMNFSLSTKTALRRFSGCKYKTLFLFPQ